MASYFVQNLSNRLPEGDYPGIHINASTEASAFVQFRSLTNAQPGDRLRATIDGPNYIFFSDVVAGAPVTQPAVKPPLPPVGS